MLTTLNISPVALSFIEANRAIAFYSNFEDAIYSPTSSKATIFRSMNSYFADFMPMSKPSSLKYDLPLFWKKISYPRWENYSALSESHS